MDFLARPLDAPRRPVAAVASVFVAEKFRIYAITLMRPVAKLGTICGSPALAGASRINYRSLVAPRHFRGDSI